MSDDNTKAFETRGVIGTRFTVPSRKKDWTLLPLNLAREIVSLQPRERRALLIGINYSNTQLGLKLKRPQGDVQLMKRFLMSSKVNYREDEITVITDAPGTPEHLLPTHANIMRELTALVRSDVKDYVFLYSGHSGQQDEPEGDNQTSPGASTASLPEEDGKDEYIIPTDAIVDASLDNLDPDKIILDNVLKQHLIRPLPFGSQFLAVMDSCHSATLLDLKHHRCNRVKSWGSRVRRSLRRAVVEPTWSMITKTNGGLARSESMNLMCNGFCPRHKHLLQLTAVCISACKDSQIVLEGGSPTLTETIVTELEAQPDITLQRLVHAIVRMNELQRAKVKAAERFARRSGDEKKSELLRELLRTWRHPQVASIKPLEMRHQKVPLASGKRVLTRS